MMPSLLPTQQLPARSPCGAYRSNFHPLSDQYRRVPGKCPIFVSSRTKLVLRILENAPELSRLDMNRSYGLLSSNMFRTTTRAPEMGMLLLSGRTQMDFPRLLVPMLPARAVAE